MRDFKQYLTVTYKAEGDASATSLNNSLQSAYAAAEFLLSKKDYDTNNKNFTTPYKYSEIIKIKGNGGMESKGLFVWNETFQCVTNNYTEKFGISK